MVDSDIEIARRSKLKPISEVAAKLGLASDQLLHYGPYKAKIALDYVKTHARTPEQQDQAIRALEFKCDVLWVQLDALYFAYVDPKMAYPGAFAPKEI